MNYFSDGSITYNGQTFSFYNYEAAQYENSGNYWHGRGDPSSWLGETIYRVVKEKIKTEAAETQVLEEAVLQHLAIVLAAQVLGISESRMDSLLDWHDNYMRWHDGDENYTAR